MAQAGKTIVIPVQFHDAAASYKTLINNFETELKKVKPGTSIYDDLVEQLKNAKKFAGKLDLKLGANISKNSDISALEKDFINLHAAIEKISKSYQSLKFEDLNLNGKDFGDLAQNYKSATDELDSLKKKIESVKKISIEELFKGDTNALKQFGKDEFSKSGLEAFKELTSEASKTSEAIEQTTNDIAVLEKKLKSLKHSGSKEERFSRQVVDITQNTKTTLVDRKENLKNQLSDFFNKRTGEWKAGADANQAEKLMQVFGMDQETINKILNTIPGRFKLIEEAVDKVTQKSFSAAHSAHYEAGTKNKKETESVISKLNKTKSIKADKEGELRGIQSRVDVLKDRLVNLGVVDENGKIIQLDQEVKNLEGRVGELEKRILKTVGSLDVPEAPPPTAPLSQEFDASKQAELFKDNLKGAVKQWFGLHEVINMVKNGVRQAVSDIQGLDKAMTNIAVVTDMSIGELWGKINEYMAVAKQYGVTTQGVYEVSQLYYQQGLSQAEVTELTTETLKLARVANMDYAKSADAMTVALRGFKMEMSDAARVTDVYSEVAAITASSQAELANAMSKTASSAASVGSSFENTTAMLAVMVETTRESAQNLGSALKSIISRYGEMKVGVTVDSEGEALDYNKVDTALKSVGISIKDAKGQFRDFDDVIFELSEKWDSLDKNTQRYIATIMAGNRQQSRFIALVDNWERLDEVSKAAADSQDAGLLQYAKTMDSLETKINNIKTSFQQFYMDLLNGPVIGGALEFVNKIIEGFNKLSKITTTLNLASLIVGIKNIANVLIDNLYDKFEQMFKKLKEASLKAGRESMENYQRGADEIIAKEAQRKKEKTPYMDRVGVSGHSNNAWKDYYKVSKEKSNAWGMAKGVGGITTNVLGSQLVQLIGNAIGAGLSVWGSKVAATNQTAGAAISSTGTAITSAMTITKAVASMGGALGAAAGPIGLVAGALIGIVSYLVSVPSKLEKAQEDLANAQKEAEEANIKRAEAQKEAKDLDNTISKLKELQRVRYRSQEAEKEYMDACAAAAEQFPYLEREIDGSIDAIENVTENERILAEVRLKAADATLKASEAELKSAYAKKEVLIEQEKAGKYNTTLEGYFGYDDNTAGIFFKGYEELGITAETTFSEAVRKLYENILTITDEVEREEEIDRLETFVNEWLGGEGNLDIHDYLSDANSYNTLWQANEAAIKAGQKAVVKATVEDLQLGLKEDQLKWQQVAGAQEAYLQTAYSQLEGIEKYFDETTGELTSEGGLKLLEIQNNLQEKFSAFYTSLGSGIKLDNFNEFFDAAKKGNFSIAEIREELKKYSNIPEELRNSIVLPIAEASMNLRAYLQDQSTGFKNWNILDTFNIPLMYQSYITDFNDYLKSQVENKTIDETAAANIVKEYSSAINELYTTDLIPDDLIPKVEEILYTGDWTSIDGIYSMLKALQDLGIDTSFIDDNFTNIIDSSVYNLVTESEALLNKVASNFDSATKAIQNAANGLDSIEEVVKMINELGLSMEDFQFIDGKYYLNDINKAAEKIQQDFDDQLKAVKNEFSTYSEALTSSSYVFSDKNSLEALINADTTPKEVKQALKSYGESYLETKPVDEDGNAIPFAAYVSAQGENLSNAIAKFSEEYLAWYISESEKEMAKITAIEGYKDNAYAGDEKSKEKLEKARAMAKAKSLILSKGLTGFSDDERYDLEQAYGDSISFIVGEGGTWDAIFSEGAEIDPEITAKLNDDVQASRSKFFELYLKAIEGTLSEMEQTEFNTLKEEEQFLAYAQMEGETTARLYYKYLFDAISAGISGEELKKITDTSVSGMVDELFAGKNSAFLNAGKAISEANGEYSTDSVKKILSEYQNLYGGEDILFTDEDIDKWFDVDEFGNLILATTEGMLPELAKFFEESELQKQVNDAIKADDLSKSINETIGNMLADTSKVTLSQIQKLYEDLGLGDIFNKWVAEGISSEELIERVKNYAAANKISDPNMVAAITADGQAALQRNYLDAYKRFLQGVASAQDKELLKSKGKTDSTSSWEDYINELHKDSGGLSEDALRAEFEAAYNELLDADAGLNDAIKEEILGSEGKYSAETLAKIYSDAQMNLAEGAKPLSLDNLKEYIKYDEITKTIVVNYEALTGKVSDEYLNELKDSVDLSNKYGKIKESAKLEQLNKTFTEDYARLKANIEDATTNDLIGLAGQIFEKEEDVLNWIAIGDTLGWTMEKRLEDLKKAAENMNVQINPGLEAAIISDEATASANNFFDLYLKAIKGTISQVELNSLTNESDPQVQAFNSWLKTQADKTLTQYEQYIKYAIENKDLTEEQRKQWLNEGYTGLFEDAFGKNDIGNDIISSAGQYSRDILIKALASTGKDYSEADLKKWFSFDEITGKFAIASAEFLQQMPEELRNYFVKSEYQEALNNAIKTDNLSRTFSKEFVDMYTNAEEVSLQQLQELYESIEGEGTFNGIELRKVQEALKAGEQGVQNYLNSLLEIAKNKGITVDESYISSALADFAYSIIQNLKDQISSLISGTMSNQDFDAFVKDFGLDSNFKQNYVTQTIDGLKINAEGLVSIVDDYTKKVGNTYAASKQLASLFAESDTTLATYEGIDKEIEKLVSLNRELTAEEQSQLNTLRLIKAEYSQMSSQRMFDFMNVDLFDGNIDNFKAITDSLSNALGQLSSAFQKGGKIEATSFLQIMEWMEDFGSTDSIKGVVGDLDKFKNAMIATMDLSGNLDFSKLDGITIGFDNFAKDLEASFNEIAKEQADYWAKYADFLEGLDKLNTALKSEDFNLEIPFIQFNTEGAADQQSIDELQTYLNALFEKAGITDKNAQKEFLLHFGIDLSDGLTEEEYNTLITQLQNIKNGNIEAIDAATKLDDSLRNPDGTSKNTNEDIQSDFDKSKATIDDTTKAVEDLNREIKELGGKTITFNANMEAVYTALNKLQETTNLTLKATIVPVGDGEEQEDENPPGNLNSIRGQLIARYAGNVSGLALYNGANFANKTLVGELGPELAVYDNMYHLLGQNGAEFVDLPDDAIVFNHRQTEGIIKGQAGYRGKALVNGNVSGPAFAGGFSDAAKQARTIASMWQAMIDKPIKDLLESGGGGGGGGNSITAHIEDLEEWYNLLRQIENLEQSINNLQAKRNNITDGREYLRNLRETQSLLEQQLTTQKILYEYQKKQLKLQADNINNNKIWSQFLTVGENGLLQYKFGNEDNGGKGALSVLQQLNQMSGKDQIKYVKSLGYSYTTTDGKALKDSELVDKFFEELQHQIDSYDGLYDEVNKTTATMEQLETSIEDVNVEIRENQISLENAVYEAIVEQRENEIELLEEQNELIKEANEAYISGIKEAISNERELYEREQGASDREQLQRRLALLKMSGGSASEIADLEAQLDETLKNEYFTRQEESLQAIQDASDRQIERMDNQIRIMEENLEYEKEMGLLWNKVYEILAKSDEEITKFITDNNKEFISTSTIQQREMLTQWAKEIGIYKENQEYEYHKEQAPGVWSKNYSSYQSVLEGLDEEQLASVKETYSDAYANAKLDGMSDEEAAAEAWKKSQKTIEDFKNYNKPPSENSGGSGGNGSTGSGSGSGKNYNTVKVSVSAANSSQGNPKITSPSCGTGYELNVPAGETVTFIPVAQNGYDFDYITYNNTKKNSKSITVSGKISSVKIVVYYKRILGGASSGATRGKAAAMVDLKYADGGIADFTGLAQLDGTPSKPEAVLNPKQTEAFMSLVENYRKLAQFENPLVSYMNAYGARVGANIAGTHNNDNSNNVTVAPGAVQIAVAQLNDKYDVEELANDVMNRMVVIANKATNRGVNRR